VTPEGVMRLTQVLGLSCVLVVVGLTALDASAELQDSAAAQFSEREPARPDSNPWRELIGLPVAAALGAALAFRPVHRGTPARDPAVIQTQIVLAVVGALIMMVVGASLARAFGILGAANLVRYRAKIGDPKDAAVSGRNRSHSREESMVVREQRGALPRGERAVPRGWAVCGAVHL
jgi:hypothetical protein